MIHEIKLRRTGKVLFSFDGDSFKMCVEAAVKARANLADADLADADLADADLARTDLAGANLADANLVGANLAGAKWHNGSTLRASPVQIHGLLWPITILDEHMEIGCELHTFAEWREVGDARIVQMGGKAALKFWRANKDALLALCATREEKAKEAA